MVILIGLAVAIGPFIGVALGVAALLWTPLLDPAEKPGHRLK
ncbi:hypothetical protein FB565_007622 [Actinoplanes lutulentus]|uniref:Uncharacterized protein n=1 Tax=Actinoplanes lutulentus TaxID=1287878 RepID=A0A327Z6E4_9ACTN|nr:hypothetical protein [Actinoplanes lutulentus]MBB2947851.1 hypothetical protein [Actinoplanes lutulentus]RAK29836.1 hypothetical protein B0I29_117162 [Actinoplanes lutulentus]